MQDHESIFGFLAVQSPLQRRARTLFAKTYASINLSNFIMYDLLKGSAQAAIASIQALIAEQRSIGRTDELMLCRWRGDPQLIEVISNIKVLSRRLSRDCTKLVLVGVNNPSPNDVGSLIGEMLAQIDEYAAYFVNAFNSCSVSSYLFVLVATPVAFMLDQVVELADTLAAGQFQKAPQVAGAIMETAETTIDKNLPSTNKVAYRRCLMSKVCVNSCHYMPCVSYVPCPVCAVCFAYCVRPCQHNPS